VEPSDTLRFKLTLHYDGAAFHGWQLQPDRRTVQGELEAALSRLADRPRRVLASGRTDTGVHATGQVASVDMPGWDAAALHRSLNAILPEDTWIAQIEVVPSDFHPRYDAVSRTYVYRVGLTSEAASPFHRRWCWALCRDVDRQVLESAATAIVGEHSFLAFSKSGQPERGDRCHVHRAAWSPFDLGVELTITADRYLHHMVRYLVGTMIDMGLGRRLLSEMTRLLGGDDEVQTSPPAPPQGLFLTRVEYTDTPWGESPSASSKNTARA
jgi:tRNA pseudouridine38-40 synthase